MYDACIDLRIILGSHPTEGSIASIFGGGLWGQFPFGTTGQQYHGRIHQNARILQNCSGDMA